MARIGIRYRDLDLLVDYDYQPAYRGIRDSTGAPEEPDESEDVQINGVYAVCDCHNEIEITAIMSSRDFHEIEHLALSGLQEDWAESRYDRYADT